MLQPGLVRLAKAGGTEQQQANRRQSNQVQFGHVPDLLKSRYRGTASL
jgi:hypothetical protein